MNWNKDFELLMRDLGVEPYGCQVVGCSHVSGGMMRMVYHHLHGRHDHEEV